MSNAEHRTDDRSLRAWLGLTLLIALLVVVAVGARLASVHEVLSALPLPDDARQQLLRDELHPGMAWLAATPVIAWLGQRFAFGRLRWPRLLALHLGAGAVIAALVQICEPVHEPVLVIDAGGDAPFASTSLGPELRQLVDQLAGDLRTRTGGPAAQRETGAPRLWWSYATKVATYLLLAAIAGGLTFRRRAILRERDAARTERELARSELRALRAQLQPHFLFNALNSVQVLLDDDLAGGRRMLRQLASLLRASLTCIDRTEVPLHDEIEVLRNYVAIEHIRFQDRIRITIEVEADLDAVLVPPFCLQPLVENALHHGPGAVARGGSITVSARRTRGELLLEVTDDGPGASSVAEGAPAGGFGVHNVRERLRRLYGDRARLDLSSPSGGGFTAAIHVPIGPAVPVTTP